MPPDRRRVDTAPYRGALISALSGGCQRLLYLPGFRQHAGEASQGLCQTWVARSRLGSAEDR